MVGSPINSLGNIYTPKVSEAQFKSWMASIEERLRTLETQQRLFNASIKGGAITVYNNTLVQIARLGLGTYSTTAGPVTRNVLAISDDSGNGFHYLTDSLRGLVSPAQTISWSPETAFRVNSVTATVAWRANVDVTTKVIEATVYHNTDPGTTGEFWLDIDLTHQTNHYVSVTAGALNSMVFQWDISSYALNWGQTITIRLYGQITVGAGSMYLLAPEKGIFGTIDNFPAATVGGF